MCGAGFHLHTLHMVLRDLPQLTMTAFSAQGILGGDQTTAPFINVGTALQTLHLHRTIDRPGCMGRHLDVHTGEVMAMTSLPTYNPNKLAGSDPTTRRNAVTYNLYELGSVVKPLSIGAAIDNGVVTSMAKRYDATQPLAIAGFRIRDSHMMNR